MHLSLLKRSNADTKLIITKTVCVSLSDMQPRPNGVDMFKVSLKLGRALGGEAKNAGGHPVHS